MWIVWDGTYCYIEKVAASPAFEIHFFVFPDGYVLDSIGPYFADVKNNDAGVTQHILRLIADLTDWLQEGDVCVVDRGFKDVINESEQ